MTDRVKEFMDTLCDYAKAKNKYEALKENAFYSGVCDCGKSPVVMHFASEMDANAKKARQLLASMLGRPEDEL